MLFDFLFDHQGPTAGQTQTATTAGEDPNGVVARQLGPSAQLQQAPQMQTQPGLLHNLWDQAKSPHGLMALSTAIRDNMGDSGAFDDQARIEKGWADQRKEQQALQDRTQKNAAFKAAYKDGKFDPAVYTSGLGEANVDPSDIADLVKAFAPKTGVDGGTAYTINPNGEVQWGEQRPMSHAEEATQARDAETAHYHELLDHIAQGKLGVAQQNAGTNSYRAHKPPASGGGHASTNGAGMGALETELRRRGLIQ